MVRVLRWLANVAGVVSLLTLASCAATDAAHRCSMWIDAYDGEPTTYAEMLDDLAGARVIYIGERHTVDRHHEIQRRIVTDLIAQGIPLVLGLEQMEAPYQPALDEYNAGRIDFDELARRTDWSRRWSNYEDYRPVIAAAHASGAPVLALNAKRETVHQVARQGFDGLAAELRAELPDEVNLDDPMYAGHLAQVMMVHAGMPKSAMRRMFEAQVARDETMADRLCNFLRTGAGTDRVAVVLCGAGHCAHGMGIPSRVRRRMPDVKDRILVLSESGDVVLAEREKKMARAITITHEQMRRLNTPVADYLHAVSLKPAPATSE